MQADSVKPVFEAESNDDAIEVAVASIGLKSEGFDKIMKDLLPTSLIRVEDPSLNAELKESLPEIMKLYLTHNQSFLTDFKFFGFPFHYWYTAQFLLILFVVLCLIYAVMIEKINKRHEIVEET
jgi:putative solute:sodium symporter small subunit